MEDCSDQIHNILNSELTLTHIFTTQKKKYVIGFERKNKTKTHCDSSIVKVLVVYN